MQAILGPKAAWSTADYLLAGILDAENLSLWQRTGDKKVPRPQPTPRPGGTEERPSGPSLAERQRRLLELRARTAKDVPMPEPTERAGEVTDGS